MCIISSRSNYVNFSFLLINWGLHNWYEATTIVQTDEMIKFLWTICSTKDTVLQAWSSVLQDIYTWTPQ